MLNTGLNLYSIRNFLETEEDFLKVAFKLKEMGYEYMQFSGSKLDYKSVKRVVEESGMPVYLTHSPYDRIIGDTEKLMEEHAEFGCKNIGLGMMPISAIESKSAMADIVSKLDKAGEVMEKNGFKLFYHNHFFEFYKFDGQTIFDYMIENAPHLNYTLDTYWVQNGGYNVLEFLDKLNGKIECVHLKDYGVIPCVNEKGENFVKVSYVPVGDGSLPFQQIVDKMRKLGTKYFFVEQDNAALLPDTLGQVERSIKYIKNNIK